MDKPFLSFSTRLIKRQNVPRRGLLPDTFTIILLNN